MFPLQSAFVGGRKTECHAAPLKRWSGTELLPSCHRAWTTLLSHQPPFHHPSLWVAPPQSLSDKQPGYSTFHINKLANHRNQCLSLPGILIFFLTLWSMFPCKSLVSRCLPFHTVKWESYYWFLVTSEHCGESRSQSGSWMSKHPWACEFSTSLSLLLTLRNTGVGTSAVFVTGPTPGASPSCWQLRRSTHYLPGPAVVK